VALEEGREVPEVSRRLYLSGASGVDASNLSAGIKALAQRSAVKRRVIMMVRRLGDCSVARHFVSPAAAAPCVRSLHFFTWSSDRAVDACRWRAQQLLGPPALRSLKRAHSRARLPGATVGVLDTGVSQSTCSWAPSSAHLQPRGAPTTQAMEKTLTRRRLVRRTTTKTAKDQKTCSRAPAGEERNYVHVRSAHLRAEQEDNGQKIAYRPRYLRQGGDQLSLCLHKATQWLLATSLKIAWTV
jgi:hypothetical protein